LRDPSGQSITLTADLRIDARQHLTGAVRVDPGDRGGEERDERVHDSVHESSGR
jgi:hypothetical protein